MTLEQIIQAMTLLGFTQDVNYVITDSYESITMIAVDLEQDIPEKPSEQSLQDALDAEAAKLVEIARKAAVQVRIDALGDLALVIDKYLKNNNASNDASFNLAGFQTVEKLESDFGFSAGDLSKPSIDDLEALVSSLVSEENQKEINEENQAFLDQTDWKVLRHIREKALNVATSMTEEEYLTLEQQRQDKAKAIVH